jgi:hypothetical protein
MLVALDKRHKAEQEAHYRWRRAEQALVIAGFLNRLEEERQWVARIQTSGGRAAPADANKLPWRHAEDLWLWTQVNVEGFRLGQVFEEWKQRAAHRNLKDPWESAKKIVQKGR